MKIKILNILKSNKIKITKQRELVLDALLATKAPLTVEEIVNYIEKNNEKMSISTCYRVLKTFEEKEMLVVEYQMVLERRVFSFKSSTSCCVLKCVVCSKKFPAHSETLHKTIEEICANNNFSIERHKLELIGRCSRCKNHSAVL